MMTRKQSWRTSCALLTTIGLLQPTLLLAAQPEVTTGPRSSALVAGMQVPAASEPRLTAAAKIALLRQKVKYVFVLFQENRSFDQHFGTFPGANGLVPGGNQPGYTQQIVNTDGTVGTISPFKIPLTIKDTDGNTVALHPEDTDSVDHSHTGIVNDEHLVNGVTLNDRFALNAEGLTTDADGNIVSRTTGAPLSSLPPPSLATKQKAELVMSHLDCDNIPFLWQYADRFTLLDNFHMSITSASTPNAIAMISGQNGVTQMALHPELAGSNAANPAVKESGGLPMLNDDGPYAGSNFDTSKVQPPYGPKDETPAIPALNQTYASLPLSFMGSNIDAEIQNDQNPALDLADVRSDIKVIGAADTPVAWGWYQEGYDHEPTDGTGPATYDTYITHHNGPQYFGYLGDNTQVLKTNLHGLGDFFSDITNHKMPKGGVFYVRGGYGNNDGLTPVDTNMTVQQAFTGSDDHPGYSDAQISEALVADEVNAIAASPYWKDSAIVITYDETDGLYDHVPESTRNYDSFGNPNEASQRIPAIVISPYAAVHAISHRYSEHTSIIKLINEIFGLKPLELLPDEKRARALGKTEFGQDNLTPFDADPGIGDLSEAFDNARLSGTVKPLPAEYAAIPSAIVQSLPHYKGAGCATLNISPTDYVGGVLTDPPPADFNPRPSSTPGLPTTPGWPG
jgi:phospholipase C